MAADPRRVAEELRPAMRSIDLGRPRAIHIIGIGGAGMRAIARVLLQMGHRVSGSDGAASTHLEALRQLGATVFVGHDPEHVGEAELVTRSTAVADDNTEVAAARRRNLPVYSRAELLGALTQIRPALLVAGTHGKTTTSSMLAVLLDHAGSDPSFVIGSDVAHFASGARWGAGETFVVEADESDGTFLALEPAHAIVTSVDPDHLEFYGSAERLAAAFEAFVRGVPGTTAVCIDDPDTAPLAALPRVVTYGTAPEADLRIDDVAIGVDATDFTVTWRGASLGRMWVGLPGHHNALNAAGALALALVLGIDLDTASAGLSRFGGVARRFEYRGSHLGTRFVDDYAHLPTEVEAAVATAVAGPSRRVIASYQPHRYSRTQALGADFATSFRGVDHLVLTDIYPSGEAPRPGVTGRIVYDAVTAACPELSVSWQPTLDDVVGHLADIVGPGDLCLTLGAGDLTTVPDRVLDRLRVRYPTTIDWLTDLAPQLGASTVEFDASLGALTTYRVGGAAAAIVRVGSVDDLVRIADHARRHATPVMITGRGSNLLVADRGHRGVAVLLTGAFDTIELNGTTARMGAAVSLPAAARRTVGAGLRGFAWAVGVPGSVGGAVAMNAGGHGSDMAASVVGARVLDLATGTITDRSRSELAFGYRSSSIGSNDVVLEATFEFAPGDRDAGEAELQDIVRWRREHQPGGQNAGSVFTNPDGYSAGRLIDTAGGKGLRVGSASVSEKHANFIPVDPGGRAGDVLELMHVLVDLVRARHGVTLEPETRLVGFEHPEVPT